MKPKISTSFSINLLIGLIVILESVECFLNVNTKPVRECDWLYRENPDDCRSYFQCLHGRPVLRRCPRQLNWNKEGMFCDWKYRTACKTKKGTTIPPVEQNSIWNYYSDIWGHFGLGKGKCVPNSYNPDPQDCGSFFTCDGSGIEHRQSCPPGLHFNKQLKICDWPSNSGCTPGGDNEVASVDEEPTPPTTTTTTTSTSTTTTTTTIPTTRPTTSMTTTTSTLPPFIPPSTFPPTIPTTSSRPTTTTTEKPSQTIYPIVIPDSDFIVICYYASWGIYRRNGGKFEPSKIDPSKCTHIIYSFGCFNATTYEVEMCDPWVDGPDGLDSYRKVLALRKLGIKVLIAIGGWVDSGDLKWERMLKDYVKMEIFIRSIKRFLDTHGWDGIDFDFEYPGCPNANCAANVAWQKQAFSVLIRGTRQVCGDDVIITAAISCNEEIIKVAYDLPTLSKYLNFFNVMTYDYHGSWEKHTGIVSPLRASSSDRSDLTTFHSIQVLIAMSVPPQKICMGIPTYGTSFELLDVRNHEIGAPVLGPGPAGNRTNQRGMLSMGEICMENMPIVHRDPKKCRGPYRVNPEKRLWVSHDDPEIVMEKCDVILKNGLAGAMIWSIDMDDFRNDCGLGPNPITSAVTMKLRGPESTVYTKKWRKIRREEEAERKRLQNQRRSKSTKSRSRRRRF